MPTCLCKCGAFGVPTFERYPYAFLWNVVIDGHGIGAYSWNDLLSLHKGIIPLLKGRNRAHFFSCTLRPMKCFQVFAHAPFLTAPTVSHYCYCAIINNHCAIISIGQSLQPINQLWQLMLKGWSWLENYLTHWHPKHKILHQLACKQLKFVFSTLVSMTISSLFNLDTVAYRICADMNVVGTNSSLSNLLICLTLKIQVVNIVLNSIVLQKCNCEGFAAVMLGQRPQLPNTLMSHHFLLISSLFSPKHFLVYINAVNYRGSAGFGQDMVEGLCGKVGDQDVKDVQVSS